jgi:arginine decarboxylase
LQAYREKFRASTLEPGLQQQLLDELTAGLEGYTYLEE